MRMNEKKNVIDMRSEEKQKVANLQKERLKRCADCENLGFTCTSGITSFCLYYNTGSLVFQDGNLYKFNLLLYAMRRIMVIVHKSFQQSIDFCTLIC